MTALLGQDRFLLAGEFHYFRVPAGQWRQRLDLVTGAGLSWTASPLMPGWAQVRKRATIEADAASDRIVMVVSIVRFD